MQTEIFYSTTKFNFQIIINFITFNDIRRNGTFKSPVRNINVTSSYDGRI